LEEEIDTYISVEVEIIFARGIVWILITIRIDLWPTCDRFFRRGGKELAFL
jgi:hypothetical protein